MPELQCHVYVNELNITQQLVGHFSNKWDMCQSTASGCLWQNETMVENKIPSSLLPRYPANTNAPPEALSHDAKLTLTAPRSNEVKGIAKNSTNGLYLVVTARLKTAVAGVYSQLLSFWTLQGSNPGRSLSMEAWKLNLSLVSSCLWPLQVMMWRWAKEGAVW